MQKNVTKGQENLEKYKEVGKVKVRNIQKKFKKYGNKYEKYRKRWNTIVKCRKYRKMLQKHSKKLEKYIYAGKVKSVEE